MAKQPTFEFTAFTADGGIVTISLPAKFVVCHRCAGTGSHTNPSIDGNGITASEMEEMGDDFREDYMRGVYDIACQTCQGERVISAIDEDRLNAEQRVQWAKHCKEEEADRREDASEAWLRRAESGERF
jgi:hypothetical protein